MVHSDPDFEQTEPRVFESAKRLLAERRPEQPLPTAADIAADLRIELAQVAKALQALSDDYLYMKVRRDWQYAEMLGVKKEYPLPEVHRPDEERDSRSG